MRNCIKKIIILTVFSLLIADFNIFAKEVVLGGKEGWPAFQSSKNITKGKGRYGYESIQLDSNSFKFDEYSDLIIDFENQSNPIKGGDYEIIKNEMKISNQTMNEKFAGLSRNLGGLTVRGKEGSFFGTEGLHGSFSIEFWLCPSVAENGETVVNWESSKNIDGRLLYQVLNCSFNKGHLEWTISHFFDFVDEVSLVGTSSLIPEQWSYHALSYDSETGIVEYLVNGITEDLTYVTLTGDQDSEVSLVFLGEPSELEICPDYTGSIDDFRIIRRPYSQPDFQSAENAGRIGHQQYLPEGGSFITKPLMVSEGSELTSLVAEMSVPEQTEILFYVRSGDNFYGWTDSYPEWKPVESGEDLKGITGLYFQVAADLLTDGNGEKSPSITDIKLNFEEIPEPLPPFIVKAVAGNGQVTISWNYSVDDTAGGYYLYYGNRPGEYLGRTAIEGQSPVNVGNTSSFTLTGLENGKIYYFAVAAWSSRDQRISGNLSKEVFARPLARLKNK